MSGGSWISVYETKKGMKPLIKKKDMNHMMATGDLHDC
jgi:hypothetical protein